MEIKKYDMSDFERNDDAVHEVDEDMFGKRVFPYIALPYHTTTLAQESNLLYWAKDWSEPELWSEIETDICVIGKSYRVYQLRVKEEYMGHVREELYELNGFFLKRKK